MEENLHLNFPEKSSYLFLNGHDGKLELLISPGNSNKLSNDSELIAIICHPHPLHGGTMDNKVVYTIHKALNTVNFTTIRFNYRGVGRSEGSYGDSIGEFDDLMTIINWVKIKKPNCKILLAGFSFGAFIAFKASKEINCLYLISIAPAVQNQDYNNYLPIECPWLLIQGEQDEIVPAQTVLEWVNSLDNKPEIIKLPDASHFFHGCLIDLREAIKSKISLFMQANCS
jgi:alpha/beta superfamily hydrolase